MHVAVPTAVLPIVLRSTNKDVEVKRYIPWNSPILSLLGDNPSLAHPKSSTIL